MTYTIMILGMAAITFAVKALFFVAGARLTFPPWLRESLTYVPVAVLTAIIVPMILAPAGAVDVSLANPRLLAAAIAIAICATTRHQLLTIGGGMAVFLLHQLR